MQFFFFKIGLGRWDGGVAWPPRRPAWSPRLADVRGAVGRRECGVELPGSVQAEVAGVVPEIERLKLNRGKGGEVMRSAICRLVAARR